MSQPNRPTTFYHGTSIESAMQIQTYGFDVSQSGNSSGQLFGNGVYCTPVLARAVVHAHCKPMQGVVLQLVCDLGNCKTLIQDDPMCKTWQLHNFDSAWMPTCVNEHNWPENCIKDPTRVKIVRIIAGNTWLLERGGMCIGLLDGRLAMMGDRASGSPSAAVKRKYEDATSAPGDPALYKLLCAWNLEAVVDLLAYEGIVEIAVLREELKDEDICKMAIGEIYKKRLGNLLNHIHAEAVVHANQISCGLELLGAMREQHDNASVQVDASSKLVAILDSDHFIIDKMLTQNMVPLLVTAVSCHTNDLTLHQNTLALIDLVVSTKINIVPHVGDLLSATFCCMKTNHKDQTLQVRCISALNGIAGKNTDKGDIQKIVVSRDRIKLLLAVMDEHVMHCDLQSDLFRLFTLFLNLPYFVDAFVIAGGIQRVLSVMKKHTPQKKLQDLGWNVLTRVMCNDVVIIKKVMSEGGVGVLLSLIGLHFADRGVQLKAVRVLSLFSRNDHKIFCSKGIAGNGIDKLVTLMQMYKDDKEILGNCIHALHAFAVENKTAIATTPVMELLRNAMQLPAHTQYPNLMVNIAQLICRLCSEETNKSLAEAGFIPSILSKMSTHTDNQFAQEQCILCLKELCYNIPSQYSIFTQEGGPVIVFERIIAYPESVRIQKDAYLLLRFVSWDTVGPEFVCKKGIPAVLAGMKTHIGIACNQVHGLALLVRLMNAYRMHGPEIFETSGIDVIVESMKTHNTNTLVVSNGLQILWHLSNLEIAIVWAIPVILMTIVTHPDNKHVLYSCLSILVSMSKSSDAAVKKLLRDSEALHVVTEKFPKKNLNTEQQEMLSHFIRMLTPEHKQA